MTRDFHVLASSHSGPKGNRLKAFGNDMGSNRVRGSDIYIGPHGDLSPKPVLRDPALKRLSGLTGVASRARVNPGQVQEILEVLFPVEVRVVDQQRRREGPVAMLWVGQRRAGCQ